MNLPFTGIRVVDLTHFVAGPWCTMLLADLGADVVKIEPPHTGEIARSMGAVYAGTDSAIFLAFNRNKRSIELDLKTTEGQAIAHQLVTDADVVVQNLRPAAAARLAMDTDSLHRVRSDLIYCSISAFGQDGPYTAKPGNDPIIQALAGTMLLGRDEAQRPIRLGVSLPDFAAGILAALSIAAALLRRQRTGDGATLELNLLDAQLFAQLDHILATALGQTVPTATDAPTELPVLGLAAAFAARPHLTTAAAGRGRSTSLKLTRTPVDTTPRWPIEHRRPPQLGEHTREVLAELGIPESQITELAEAGVIGAEASNR